MMKVTAKKDAPPPIIFKGSILNFDIYILLICYHASLSGRTSMVGSSGSSRITVRIY